MIKIEKLNVELPKFALQDINLHIPEGDFFTLLGPTGSGKSVLLGDNCRTGSGSMTVP